MIFMINPQGLNFAFFVAEDAIIAAPNHPADRLMNKSAIALNQTAIL